MSRALFTMSIGDLFSVCVATDLFWFRIFGRGVALSKNRKPKFSERYGFRRVYRVRKWSFEIL